MKSAEIIYRNRLIELSEADYRDFCIKLTPTVASESVLGVRTPKVRALAKEMHKNGDANQYIKALPHRYYEENNLHAFILEDIKDFNTLISELDRFLPYVDNWATCDCMSPKIFKNKRAELLEHLERWLLSPDTYTVRFAIKTLMQHYLDKDFKEEYFEKVIGVSSEEYYLHMMKAWYFATALAKQYDSALIIIKERRLDRRTHNKAIQKACESRRITTEQKHLLRSLKY